MKVAIVGAGKLGLKLATALIGGDHDVTLIDKNQVALQKIQSQFDVMTINENAKQISVLKDLHISSYDYLITATDKDEKNIVIASFAKQHIFARPATPRTSVVFPDVFGSINP